jgi:hypothetical protein
MIIGGLTTIANFEDLRTAGDIEALYILFSPKINALKEHYWKKSEDWLPPPQVLASPATQNKLIFQKSITKFFQNLNWKIGRRWRNF